MSEQQAAEQANRDLILAVFIVALFLVLLLISTRIRH
jgi:hypothetical protein